MAQTRIDFIASEIVRRWNYELMMQENEKECIDRGIGYDANPHLRVWMDVGDYKNKKGKTIKERDQGEVI